jgi:hypothetical protein
LDDNLVGTTSESFEKGHGIGAKVGCSIYMLLEPCIGGIRGVPRRGCFQTFLRAIPRWGSLEGHPKYILLVLSYTSNYFACICRSSVITSTRIALPLLAPRVTVLCCWSALTVWRPQEQLEDSANLEFGWKLNKKQIPSLIDLVC